MQRLQKLTYENKKLREQNCHLKDIRNIGKILNADQIEALHNKTGRIRKWSDDTVRKALRLKLSAGTSGYEELLKQGIPLPAARTLRKKYENFDFKSGISEEIFDALKEVASQFPDDRQRDCMIAIDMRWPLWKENKLITERHIMASLLSRTNLVNK